MKTDKNLVKNLARTADVLNTIHGGMSQSTIKIKHLDNEWLIMIKIPGVDLEHLFLEVFGNHLYIHQMMEIQKDESERAPYVVAMIPLAREINVEAITATYQEGWTVINLPFDEMVSGHNREIKIERI